VPALAGGNSRFMLKNEVKSVKYFFSAEEKSAGAAATSSTSSKAVFMLFFLNNLKITILRLMHFLNKLSRNKTIHL